MVQTGQMLYAALRAQCERGLLAGGWYPVDDQ